MTVRTLTLEPMNPRVNATEVVLWDPEAGTLTGKIADQLAAIYGRGLDGLGGQPFPMHPHPASFTLAKKPLKDPASVAVLLGLTHKLPEELARHYPAITLEETDDDASADLRF